MAAAEAAAFRDVDEVGWYRAPPNSALRAAAVFDNCVCGIGPPTGTDADMCSDVRRKGGTATDDDWYAKATPNKHAAEAAGKRVVLMVKFGRFTTRSGGMMTPADWLATVIDDAAVMRGEARPPKNEATRARAPKRHGGAEPPGPFQP